MKNKQTEATEAQGAEEAQIENVSRVTEKKQQAKSISYAIKAFKQHFYPIVLADNNFRKTPAAAKNGSHNVLEAFIDLTYAYVCDNRRAGGFLISDWEGGN